MVAFFSGWKSYLPESLQNCCEGNSAANYHWLMDQLIYLFGYTCILTKRCEQKWNMIKTILNLQKPPFYFPNVCHIIDSLTFVFATPNHDRSPPQATSRKLDKRYNGADPSTQRWIHETPETPRYRWHSTFHGHSIVCSKCKSSTPKEKKWCVSL